MPGIDPIAELVRDLRETGKPSLQWIVRWSQGGRDPVQAAWEHSQDPGAMLYIGSRSHHGIIDSYEIKSNDTPIHQMRRLVGFQRGIRSYTVNTKTGDRIRFNEGIDPDGADAMRTLIKPPTLAALLEASQRATVSA